MGFSSQVDLGKKGHGSHAAIVPLRHHTSPLITLPVQQILGIFGISVTIAPATAPPTGGTCEATQMGAPSAAAAALPAPSWRRSDWQQDHRKTSPPSFMPTAVLPERCSSRPWGRGWPRHWQRIDRWGTLLVIGVSMLPLIGRVPNLAQPILERKPQRLM